MSDPHRLRTIAAAAAAERWSLPAVEGPIVSATRDGAPLEVGESTRLAQAERARGYESGLAAGGAEIERLKAELGARIKRLDSILGALARPLAELDGEVQRQLVMLTLAIGKQLARRELRAQPAEIIGLIRESMNSLPATARDVRVHLHPEDAALVRGELSQTASERAWSIVEDPTQTRGGCLVRTETSQVDARFETRVSAIVSALLGDERTGARAASAAPAGESQA